MLGLLAFELFLLLGFGEFLELFGLGLLAFELFLLLGFGEFLEFVFCLVFAFL